MARAMDFAMKNTGYGTARRRDGPGQGTTIEAIRAGLGNLTLGNKAQDKNQLIGSDYVMRQMGHQTSRKSDQQEHLRPSKKDLTADEKYDASSSSHRKEVRKEELEEQNAMLVDDHLMEEEAIEEGEASYPSA